MNNCAAFRPPERKRVLRQIAVLLLLQASLLAPTLSAQTQRLEDVPPGAALVTVAPDGGLLRWFGHTALLITFAKGEHRLFDYGIVIAGPAAVAGVLRGTITAHGGEHDAAQSLARWANQGRVIVFQPLNLSQRQLFRLLERLEEDKRREPNGYRYDMRNYNCTTRIRDLLDEVTGGALRRAGAAPSAMTLREQAYQYVPIGWVVPAGDFIFNATYDEPVTAWEAAMYPERLAALVASAVNEDGEFAGALAPPPGGALSAPPRYLSRLVVPSLLLGTLIGGGAVILGLLARGGYRGGRRTLGGYLVLSCGVMGLLGSTLVAGWIFTSYPFMQHNATILLLNPLLIFAVPLGIGYAAGSARSGWNLRRLIWICAAVVFAVAGLKAVSLIRQDIWRTLSFVVPAVTGFAAAMRIAEPRNVPTH